MALVRTPVRTDELCALSGGGPCGREHVRPSGTETPVHLGHVRRLVTPAIQLSPAMKAARRKGGAERAGRVSAKRVRCPQRLSFCSVPVLNTIAVHRLAS